MSRELLQQALDALTDYERHTGFGRTITDDIRAALAQPAPAVPADMVMVPLSFVQGFNTLAHNWSLRAEPPSFYTGTEGDAFARAYAECGQALAKLRAMIAAAPAVREPLTAERLQKHAMFAADAPPASAVVLVSSLHRLLGITGDSAPAVQPLTDEQIDEIWDGTFDSADPKRQLSFRQIITRAIERAHGITGDSK